MYFLILFTFVTHFCSSFSPVVNTKYGDVKGFVYERKDNQKSNIFLGIPFAKPPIGRLRFEKPSSPLPWSTPLDATVFGPSCYPHNQSITIEPANENCLTLNIMSPQRNENESLFPVLVWIHAGGYQVGSAGVYGYKSFSDIYNSEDVLVVTIQYRLGFLGFFSDSSSIPGNYGSWDQMKALEFVKENIEKFGGDSQKITIWGYSAGGSSTGQLAMSEHTNKLFHRFISMSGSAYSNWAFSEESVKHSIELAEAVGCSNEEERKECLKGKTISELYSGVERIGGVNYGMNMLKWTPRIDGYFYSNQPEEMIKKAPRMPQILGTAQKESAYFTISNNGECLQKVGLSMEKQKSFGRKDFEKTVKELLATEQFYGENKEEAFEAITDFYLGCKDEKQAEFYVEKYAKLFTDTMFSVAVAREAIDKSIIGNDVYLYMTEHYNHAIYPSDSLVKGATHVSEYPYIMNIFEMGKFDIENDEIEKKITKTFRESFVNFVKTGIPSNTVTEWLPTTINNPLQYLHINSNPSMKQNLFKETLEFWNGMTELGYDIISMRNRKQKVKTEL